MTSQVTRFFIDTPEVLWRTHLRPADSAVPLLISASHQPQSYLSRSQLQEKDILSSFGPFKSPCVGSEHPNWEETHWGTI